MSLHGEYDLRAADISTSQIGIIDEKNHLQLINKEDRILYLYLFALKSIVQFISY